MQTSEQINELAAALAKAQGEMSGAVKDATNPFFKSSYADLASVIEASRSALSKHGLAVIQSPSAEGTTVSLDTLLVHSSGQWVRGTMTMTAKDDSPQALGSCVSYAKRYALQAFVGVASVDDDGEAAQGRSKPQAQTAAPLPPSGYHVWLDELKLAAGQGTPALEGLWKMSKREYREFLSATAKTQWETLKAQAAAATKAVSA